ncbi:TonB-dependent receptor [Neokomagataea thailandica NBRC 106555]|uniref:TonB-dependent receptor n=2 Tax=Neokomagataea TaxID=1223423 RepID=A0A4Y6V663_9PROT|nr:MULTISPECIES: TonB-dependent receptor [Neokomagataea]QDH24111.1 TonB-dependent receptor [Neokomagataea tanensis]GBR50417.1 TonB-dependent receptor [Neokomagataea thailandica NBRC 106555]
MKKTFLLTTCLCTFAATHADAAVSGHQHRHHAAANHTASKPVSVATPSTARNTAAAPSAFAASNPQPVRSARVVKSAPAQAETMVVLGAGAARETQSISRRTLQEVAPGTNPMKTLSKLPGVMFSSSDPLGSYEWSQQILVRGFDQGRLGYTMDGIPLGNMAYGNTNGLSPNRSLQIENNGPSSLAQGAGSVGIAASNDLGGTMQFTSIDPTDKFGADLAGTIGSATTWRTFARINSGILPTGGKFYVSYDYQDADKWKGYGKQKQQQANAKLVQPLGEYLKLTVFGDWSLRKENDYQDLSVATVNKYGYNVDNITNNYALAKQVATSSTSQCPAGIGTTNYGDCQDFAYWNAAGLRQDALGYGRLDFHTNDRFKGFATVYGHTNSGEGVWATPYTATPASLGGTPISIRTTEYSIHRIGFLTGASYQLSNHLIEAGFWFQDNNFKQARRFYALPENNPPGTLHWYKNNAFATQWQNSYNTKTYQIHLQDTWKITNALKANYGFKSLIVNNSAIALPGNYMGTPTTSTFPTGKISATDGFLPQVGVNYRINHNNEIFADFARNMAAFDASGTGLSPFAMKANVFDATARSIKPEHSNTEELGYRYHDSKIQASLTGYYVQFQNRLLAISQGVGVQGLQSVISNVGSVTARGIDAAFNYNFTTDWSFYASYAFNNSYYNNDLTTGGITYRTAGKSVVAMPRNLANVQLSYDNGSVWGNVLMQFQDRRTYTYTNDQWIDPNAIFNLNVGYRFHSQNIVLRGLDAQINVTNLFDKRYVATVGSTGYLPSDPSGTYPTLQAGAPRMVFFTIRKHFQ